MSFFDLFKTKEKTYALVLSGGGARGFFHIGVIKAIQELKIPINEVSGTSIGSLVGAIYCANPNTDFEKLINDLGFFKVIKMISSHLDKNPESKLEDYLKTIIPATTFSELKIPFSFNATDINNSKEIIFDKGNIFPYIIASCSIPGVFAPQPYFDTFLVDGGIINNIPISLIKKNRNILVSDVSVPIKTITPKSNYFDVLQSSFTIMQRNNSLENINKNSNNKNISFVALDYKNIFALDFRKKNFQELIDLGYKQTIEYFNNNGK